MWESFAACSYGLSSFLFFKRDIGKTYWFQGKKLHFPGNSSQLPSFPRGIDVLLYLLQIGGWSATCSDLHKCIWLSSVCVFFLFVFFYWYIFIYLYISINYLRIFETLPLCFQNPSPRSSSASTRRMVSQRWHFSGFRNSQDWMWWC